VEIRLISEPIPHDPAKSWYSIETRRGGLGRLLGWQYVSGSLTRDFKDAQKMYDALRFHEDAKKTNKRAVLLQDKV
jgi:hypothetical protein